MRHLLFKMSHLKNKIEETEVLKECKIKSLKSASTHAEREEKTETTATNCIYIYIITAS